MSARDEYEIEGHYGAMCDEIDRLRAELVELAPARKCICKPYHVVWCPAHGEDNTEVKA